MDNHRANWVPARTAWFLGIKRSPRVAGRTAGGRAGGAFWRGAGRRPCGGALRASFFSPAFNVITQGVHRLEAPIPLVANLTAMPHDLVVIVQLNVPARHL